MILDTFDHAFVINLDRARDKFMQADRRLRKVGIVAERLPAIVPREQGPYSSLGARGCTESHRACVQLAKDRGYKSVLIFEDDVILRWNFRRLWRRLQPAAAVLDYDLLYFFNWKQLSLFPIDLRLVPIDGTLCAHAYAVRDSYYDQLLAVYGENERIGKTNDLIVHAPSVRIFAPTYNLAGQDAGLSALNDKRKVLRWSCHSGSFCGIPIRV